MDRVVEAEAAVTLLTSRPRDRKDAADSAPGGGAMAPRRKVWVVGLTVVVSVTLAFTVAVVLVAVVVGVAVSSHCRRPLSSQRPDVAATSATSGGVPRGPEVSGKTTPAVVLSPGHATTLEVKVSGPPLPWSDIRLPPSVRPRYYHIRLDIDLASFTFAGSVNVTLTTSEAGIKFLVLHCNQLDVRHDSIELTSTEDRGHVERPWRVTENTRNQYLVIEFRRALEVNRSYTLNVIDFRGVIRDQLRGLYKSSYKSVNGTIRYPIDVYTIVYTIYYSI